MIYNYIVVGAGISGLYFSHLIKKVSPTVNLLVIESSDSFGGRILKDTNTGAQLGAKFVHDDFSRFFKKGKNIVVVSLDH
jgi:protoporphyrinogen oxidase